MKIDLELNGKRFPATLANNKIAREFIAVLPLTLTMHDLFGREKFGPLPRPVSGTGTRTRTRTRTRAYAVGDIVCWAPGPDLAIFYRHDGQRLSGAVHLLGRIDFGVEVFSAPEPLQVTIAVAGNGALAGKGRAPRQQPSRSASAPMSRA